MPARQRQQALARLQRAIDNWARRMRDYLHARSTESFVYIPEWNLDEKEARFFSAQNRFFAKGESLATNDPDRLEYKYNINLHAERLYQIAYAAELLRFVAESDLVTLLKPPFVTHGTVKRDE